MKSVFVLMLLTGTAMAQTVTPVTVKGIPNQYMQGGGCFNFLMNGVQFSIPEAALNYHTPRGGQAAIDGWKKLLIDVPMGQVTFQAGDKLGPEICQLQGYNAFDVSSP